MSDVISLDINGILATIKSNLKRAGWNKEKIENHLIITYHKNRILKLDDDELLEFQRFCTLLPAKKLIKFRELKFRKLPPAKKQSSQQENQEPTF